MSKDVLQKRLDEILAFVGAESDYEISEESNSFQVDIRGDDLSFLIGYRSESLDALQYLLNQIIFRETGEWFSVGIDINDYKSQKLHKLDDMIKSYIDRVRFHQREMRLPPLSAFERRYVHNYVGEYSDVSSESRGEGGERRLYLLPITR